MTEKTILFATDYSDASQHALSYACSLARDLDALLLIAHVSEHELYPVGEAFDEKPEPSPQEMERLRSVRPETHDIRHEYRLLYPQPTSQNVRPADELIRFADSARVHAIVVGTHGRTGLKRALMGSTAEALVRNANCPVVTVRYPSKLAGMQRRRIEGQTHMSQSDSVCGGQVFAWKEWQFRPMITWILSHSASSVSLTRSYHGCCRGWMVLRNS